MEEEDSPAGRTEGDTQGKEGREGVGEEELKAGITVFEDLERG
jgi:hypothetical protein